MVARVDIWNMALIETGANVIADPDDNNENANTCRARYPIARDAMLVAAPWRCAIQRFEVAADAAAPRYEYQRSYQLPPEPWVLRVLNISDPEIPWVREGRKILTDATSPLLFRAIFRLTDEEQFDPMLAEATALKLARDIAFKRTTTRSMVESLDARIKNVLAEARSIAGQEGYGFDGLFGDEFVRSRR